MAIDYYDASEGFGNVLNWLALTQGGRGVSMPERAPAYNALAANGGPTRAAAAASGDDREWLARAIYSEAGNEPFEGQVAVGAVIANRLQSGQYPNDYTGVILQPGQFSAFNGLTGYAGGAGANDLWQKTPSTDAYAAADAILSGQYSDPTGGALNYYNPRAASPSWGDPNWLRIGNHVFGTAG